MPIVIFTLCLVGWFANDIYQENARIQKIKGVDIKVINQLKKLRVAQQAYLSVHQTYCNNWDSLTTFIVTGNFVNLQITERVIVLPSGKDSITINIDTISVIAVFDSLKTKLTINNKQQIASIINVPVSDTVFTLRADKLSNGQNICEIRDPQPLNPRRQKNGDLKPLQIGSLSVSTLQGNWE